MLQQWRGSIALVVRITRRHSSTTAMDWVKETHDLLRAKSWSNNKWKLIRLGTRHWSQQMQGFEYTWQLLDRALHYASIHYSRRPPDVELILRDLLSDYESTKDIDLIPEGYYFHTLIQLSIKAFNESAFQDHRALERADNLLVTMLKYSKFKDGLMPTLATVEAVLTAWDQSSDPLSCQRASTTLTTLLDHAHGNQELLDIGTSTPVLRLCAKFPDNTSIQSALESFRTMRKHHITPTLEY